MQDVNKFEYKEFDLEQYRLNEIQWDTIYSRFISTYTK